MKKCPYCGAPIENKKDTMCAYCGSPFNGDPDSTSQYGTEEHYDPRLSPQQQPAAQDYSERLRQAIARQSPPTHKQEILYKAKIARTVGIIAIVFSSTFVLSVVTLIMANSVLKDPQADSDALSIAKTARALGILAIIIGILIYIGQIPLIALLSS